MNTNAKILSTVIDITQLLHSNGCTYNDADKILKLLIDEINQQRCDYEYNTVEDYLKGYKTRNADNTVIQQMNHASK